MNETAKWFEKRLTRSSLGEDSPLMVYMRKTISNVLPFSSMGGMAEDHIQSFLEKMIRRNALRKLIVIDGESGIPDSKIGLYLRRSSYNDIRNEGKNPVLRELYGFRTESEKDGDYEPKSAELNPAEFKTPLKKGTRAGHHNLDDDLLPVSGVDKSAFWMSVHDTLENRYPNDFEYFFTVLRLRAEGYNFTAISKEVNRSISTVKNSIEELRSTLNGHLGRLGDHYSLEGGVLKMPLGKTWDQVCISCPRVSFSKDDAENLFGFRSFWKDGVKVKQQPFTRCKECRNAVESKIKQGLYTCQ